MNWEYIKGSEADFEGAPQWAIQKGKIDDLIAWVGVNQYQYLKGFSGLENHSDVFHGDFFVAGNNSEEELIAYRKEASTYPIFDTVQRPAHYNQSDIECIDAIKASMTLAEFQGFLKGNIQKYVWRSSHKGQVEDLKKAKYYLDKLIGSHDGY